MPKLIEEPREVVSQYLEPQQKTKYINPVRTELLAACVKKGGTPRFSDFRTVTCPTDQIHKKMFPEKGLGRDWEIITLRLLMVGQGKSRKLFTIPTEIDKRLDGLEIRGMEGTTLVALDQKENAIRFCLRSCQLTAA